MQILNNFLPSPIFSKLSDFLRADAHWSFSGKSLDGDSESFWFADLSNTFVSPAIQVALNRHGVTVEKIHAVYANGQSRAQSGGFHVDAKLPGIQTCLIYCNDEWNEQWGGETLFINTDSSPCDGFFIMPEPNKAVIFDARLRHRGCAPDPSYTGLRKTVAFKFS